VIAGTTSKFDRLCTCILWGPGFLLFGIPGYLGVKSLLANSGNPLTPIMATAGILLTLAGFAIEVMLLRLMVWQFSYHSGELRVRTFGNPLVQVRYATDIKRIGPWRVGRVPAIRGYQIQFRDGQKFCFDFAIPNLELLIQRLQTEFDD
jgi:hypothetical protein